MGSLDASENSGRRASLTTFKEINPVKQTGSTVNASPKETPSFAMATVSSLLRQGIQVGNRPSMKPRKAYRGGDAKKLEAPNVFRRVPHRVVSNPVAPSSYFLSTNTRSITGSKSTANKISRGTTSNSSTASTYDGSQFYQEDSRRHQLKESYYEQASPYISTPTSESSCLSTPAAFRLSNSRSKQNQTFLPRVAESSPSNKILQLNMPAAVEIEYSPDLEALPTDKVYTKPINFPDSTIYDANKFTTASTDFNRPITILTQSCQLTGLLNSATSNSPILFKLQNADLFSFQKQNLYQQQLPNGVAQKIFPTESENTLHYDVQKDKAFSSNRKTQDRLENIPEFIIKDKDGFSINGVFDEKKHTHENNQIQSTRNMSKFKTDKSKDSRYKFKVQTKTSSIRSKSIENKNEILHKKTNSDDSEASYSSVSSHSTALIHTHKLKRKRPTYEESFSSLSSIASTKSRWERVANDNQLELNHFAKLSRGSKSFHKLNESFDRKNYTPNSLAWKYIDLFKSSIKACKKPLEIDRVQALFETTSKPTRKVRVHAVSIAKIPRVTSYAKRVITTNKAKTPNKSSSCFLTKPSDSTKQFSCTESNKNRTMTILRIVPSSLVTIEKELSLRQRLYNALKKKFPKTYLLWKYTAYRMQYDKLK